MRQVTLLGLRFADLDVAQAVDWLAARDASVSFTSVVTPNADHLVRLARQPVLRGAYERSGLCLLDSRVVARAACLLGLDVPRVCPGSDVVAALLERLAGSGERITIIGLHPAHLGALRQRFGLGHVAHVNPPMGFGRDPAAQRVAVDFVLAHPSRFVFLAVGSPGQELLADAITATGRATGVGLCIGAGLEFLAGARHRAPAWMQRAGIEWLHRLAQEPRRLARRYLLDDPPVFWLLLQERLARG